MPSRNGHGKVATAFWLTVVGTLLSVVFLYPHLFSPTRATLILAMLFGISFAMTLLSQLYALMYVDTNTLFPITTTLSLVVTVGVGLFIFAERLSYLQMVGVLLAIASIYFFVYHKGKISFSPLVIWVIVSTFSFSSFGKIIQKIAADGVDILAFQVYMYIFATIFVLAVYLATNRGNYKGLFSKAMLWGSINGIFSFFGSLAILIALTRGPFALITAIHSTYILVTAVIGWLFFKEYLNARKVFLICLAIVAIALMRMG
jgi:drug/metabolite transporter (DMT)-like permease